MAGQFPPRRALYDGDALAGALRVPPAEARRIIERGGAAPGHAGLQRSCRSILQVSLHRALTGQQEPRAALQRGGGRDARAAGARAAGAAIVSRANGAMRLPSGATRRGWPGR